MAFCPKCGVKIDKIRKYCPKCGAKILKVSKSMVPLFVISSLVMIALIILLTISGDADITRVLDKNSNFLLNEHSGNPFIADNVSKPAEYCGDNQCSHSETCSSCPNDCGNCNNYCGDGACDADESCENCEKDCGVCEYNTYCGDGICQSQECSNRCSVDCTLEDCVDNVCDAKFGENCDNSLDCACKVSERCQQGMCQTYCGNNICDDNEVCSTCKSDCGICECKKDFSGIICNVTQVCEGGIFDNRAEDTSHCCIDGTCVDNPSLYPLLLVHGHCKFCSEDISESLNAFRDFMTRLTNSGHYIDKGIITASSITNAAESGEWGKLSKPIVIRTTYYQSSDGSIDTNKSIDVYADRLKLVVEKVIHHTGSKKVKIVAHSMGGLVSRAYIKNHGGWKYVDKLITIGTPNHGITGGINSVCGSRPECGEMEKGSDFLNNLNAGDETYKGGDSRADGIIYSTIAAKLNPDNKPELLNPCGDGTPNHDEVVCFSSVHLIGANNYHVWADRIEGVLTDLTVHSMLINPSYIPESYNLAKDMIID